MITDPIADLLTRLRNGSKARHDKIFVPHSNLKAALLEVLKNKGFIQGYKVTSNGNRREIEVALHPAYPELNLKRVSKPGQRIYIKSTNIQRVLSGYGVAIVSTPRGVMAGDEARKLGIGGEYLCDVW